MTYDEVEKAMWAICHKAAQDAFKSFNETGCAGHWLYYKPSGMELRLAMECPEGFVLGDPETQRGGKTTEQLTRWIHDRAVRYPILVTDEDAAE